MTGPARRGDHAPYRTSMTCMADCQGAHPFHRGRCHEVENGVRCECEGST